MAVVNINPKSRIEFYKMLLAKSGQADLVNDPIWKQELSLSEVDKKALIDELQRKREKDRDEGLQAALRELRISADKLSKEEYNKLLPFISLSYVCENNGVATEHACKLILAFGTAEKAIRYLEKFEKNHPEINQVVHDACLFTVPSGEWDMKI